jgi:hypothetical protein
MKKYLICILIVIVICGGCTQSINRVYLNEAHNKQYISFGEMGTFSHYNYNNSRDLTKTGNFTANNTLLKLSYTDGQISEFYIDGNELVPINENKLDPMEKIRDKRFAKMLRQ